MNPDGPEPMACRTCHSVLNVYTDLNTGRIHYLHPLHQGDGHPVNPVPADEVSARRYCEFCLEERIVYAYTAAPTALTTTTAAGQLHEMFSSDWAACYACAEHIEARDLGALNHHVRQRLPDLDPLAHHIGDQMRQAFLLSVTGRAITAIGRWQPVPLPAKTLPKVRDRLRRLVTSGEALPGGLHEPARARTVADGLDAAGLYWVDDDITSLVQHASQDMPTVELAPEDPPAPHGFLAWAQPADHANLTAASWTTGPEGVLLVLYRSVGDGLPPDVTQRLRTTIGWIIPHHADVIRTGDRITAGHPGAAVVVTWRLIQQRLADTSPTAVDKSVRAAYIRTGRPAPTVRLVHIRGHATTPPSPSRQHTPDGTGRSGEQYRTWVAPHWRWQPYGPGRRHRRWILIAQHLRGPEDAPVRPSSTVRVLGATPPPRPPH